MQSIAAACQHVSKLILRVMLQACKLASMQLFEYTIKTVVLDGGMILSQRSLPLCPYRSLTLCPEYSCAPRRQP